MTKTGTSSMVIARRGEQWMTEDEIRAHLASVVRLEHVGLFLGSGASCGSLGGMTLKGTWEHFENEYEDDITWLKTNSFLEDDYDDVNIEALSDSLQVALIEWRRSNHDDVDELESVLANIKRTVFHAAILSEDLWKDPSQIEDLPESLHAHRNALQKLCSSRQPGQSCPWVFTTNYDLAVEWAAESLGLHIVNGFAGLHHRSFSPAYFDLGLRNTQARGEASFGTYNVSLVKLHGSLTWRLIGDESVIESPCRSIWSKINKFLEGGDGSLDEFLVLPGTLKYQQTSGFVFGELFRRFSEFLSRPQSSIIVSGYSFSDEHLNRVFKTALQNPTLQMVIFLPELTMKNDKWNFSKARAWAKKIAELQLPQVTIVGGGEAAYFTELARLLPDPAVYDDQSLRIKQLAKRLNGDGSGTLSDDSSWENSLS